MASSGKDKRIDYIEFNVRDIGRARSFYGDAFGWTFTDYGPSIANFPMVISKAALRLKAKSDRAARWSSSLPTILRIH